MREIQKSSKSNINKFQVDIELEAEKISLAAAERAKKEFLEKKTKEAEDRKAYLDSIVYFDDLEFKTKDLRDQLLGLMNSCDKILKWHKIELQKQVDMLNKLKEICSHDYVLEKRTSYRDEYDDWHNGPYQRKCIECLLVEESNYKLDDQEYKFNNSKKYSKLEHSKIIILRKIIDDKEYLLEFDDLEWSKLLT